MRLLFLSKRRAVELGVAIKYRSLTGISWGNLAVLYKSSHHYWRQNHFIAANSGREDTKMLKKILNAISAFITYLNTPVDADTDMVLAEYGQFCERW